LAFSLLATETPGDGLQTLVIAQKHPTLTVTGYKYKPIDFPMLAVL